MLCISLLAGTFTVEANSGTLQTQQTTQPPAPVIVSVPLECSFGFDVAGLVEGALVPKQALHPLG